MDVNYMRFNGVKLVHAIWQRYLRLPERMVVSQQELFPMQIILVFRSIGHQGIAMLYWKFSINYSNSTLQCSIFFIFSLNFL
jgi:hypothetical protein